MQFSLQLGQSGSIQRARRILGREAIAWSVIALIAIGAIFIQSCPDHAKAADEVAITWTESPVWAAMFNCPVHQTFVVPPGGLQGS